MTDDMFFDTDCLSAFLWINNTNILQELYGGKIVIPEPVYQELSNPSIPHIKSRADFLLSKCIATVQQIEIDKEEYKLYRSLINGSRSVKAIGKGEAAGIALAKTYDGILASNNYRDIAPYIEKYNLKHVDTGQLLMEALKKEIITEDDGNSIWKQMISKNRKLPEVSFTEYIKKNNYNGRCKT
jgi:predicted nucleic acid-binding protein